MVLTLIGLPGCGKSTVGQRLARQLGFSFLDTDALIEQKITGSIRDFFSVHGENAFRDLEEQTLRQVFESSAGMGTDTGAVVATGGGIVVRAGNRELLKRQAHVIYLHCSPEHLMHRLRHDTSRPLLQVDDPLERLRQLYDQRDPWYREVASLVVEVRNQGVKSVVETIKPVLHKQL